MKYRIRTHQNIYRIFRYISRYILNCEVYFIIKRSLILRDMIFVKDLIFEYDLSFLIENTCKWAV